MKNLFINTILILFTTTSIFAQNDNHNAISNTNNIIYLDEKTNSLVYKPYTDKGDIIPDFSFSGYKAGITKFNLTKVVKTLSPLDGDNTKSIQNALDSIGQLKADKNGIRGALLLMPGTYNLSESITIKYSGVVLMGEKDQARNTILVATTPKQYTLVRIGERENFKIDHKTKRQVVADYVPSGTRKILVNDASCFKVGDAIIVERPSTTEWITAIGMDKIEDSWSSIKVLNANQLEEYRKSGKLSEDGKRVNTTKQWEPGSKNLIFERKITAIDKNIITIDIPLTNALQKEYGGGLVYKYSYTKRLTDVGICNLSATSLFNKSVIAKNREGETYFADEQHGWTFLDFVNAENSWADNIEVTVFSFGFVCGLKSRFITIQNCRFLDPVCLIEGGRRYAYSINGQQCLVTNSYARNGRHDFVMGAVVAGPNAFVNNTAELCHAKSEPHQRWATGTLFDNCSVSGPDAGFSLSNRGSFGSGHGWAGAQMVLWNCMTPLAVVMKPPTAQNFSFGTVALTDKWSTKINIEQSLDKLNKISNNNFKYIGLPAVGDGFIFNNGESVVPKSLYQQQLNERSKK
ncbi:hypothetical protein [Pedobacter glucosidilyticus]|uniref:hypothetical protein n=1 Tax=Pedobacter glucosidilyticus TaxID=1122941 RepID=UPI00040DAC45|nr:hypothetical protein [Pedobacter glucosidilyticus]